MYGAVPPVGAADRVEVAGRVTLAGVAEAVVANVHAGVDLAVTVTTTVAVATVPSASVTPNVKVAEPTWVPVTLRAAPTLLYDCATPAV